MELEFMRNIDPAIQQLYLGRVAVQDKMLEAISRLESGWENEYEEHRRDLGHLDAQIAAEHSPGLITAMNELYLSVLEIQLVLHDRIEPVSGQPRNVIARSQPVRVIEEFKGAVYCSEIRRRRHSAFIAIP